mgnify:CR=1 FL=1
MKSVTLTRGAAQVGHRHLPQSQLGFCHSCHPRDTRVPSRHLSRLLHHWNELNVQGLEVLASPDNETLKFIKRQKDKTKNCWIPNSGQYKAQTWSNGGCGLPLQKLDSVHVAFLSIESFACSFNWASNGIKAPLLRTRSRHLGESPATFPNAHTAYNFGTEFQKQFSITII